MTIGRVASAEPIQNSSSIGKVDAIGKTNKSDSIDISAEAKKKADMLGIVEIVSSAPDVRADRVAELKAKIQDPSYLSEKILNETADKLLDVLLR